MSFVNVSILGKEDTLEDHCPQVSYFFLGYWH